MRERLASSILSEALEWWRGSNQAVVFCEQDCQPRIDSADGQGHMHRFVVYAKLGLIVGYRERGAGWICVGMMRGCRDVVVWSMTSTVLVLPCQDDPPYPAVRWNCSVFGSASGGLLEHKQILQEIHIRNPTITGPSPVDGASSAAAPDCLPPKLASGSSPEPCRTRDVNRWRRDAARACSNLRELFKNHHATVFSNIRVVISSHRRPSRPDNRVPPQ